MSNILSATQVIRIEISYRIRDSKENINEWQLSAHKFYLLPLCLYSSMHVESAFVEYQSSSHFDCVSSALQSGIALLNSMVIYDMK